MHLGRLPGSCLSFHSTRSGYITQGQCDPRFEMIQGSTAAQPKCVYILLFQSVQRSYVFISNMPCIIASLYHKKTTHVKYTVLSHEHIRMAVSVWCLFDLLYHMIYLSICFQVVWLSQCQWHDDVIKRTHFPRHRPFVRGNPRYPVDFPHKGEWRGALMFSVICAWTNGWADNRNPGDLTRLCSHYNVIAIEANKKDFVKINPCQNKTNQDIVQTVCIILGMHFVFALALIWCIMLKPTWPPVTFGR